MTLLLLVYVERGIRFVKGLGISLFRNVIAEKIQVRSRQNRKSTCGGAMTDEQLKYATPLI
jgi:hypothetical protein